ncbi:DUF411 domain-containing protein [Mariprofundus erugo]|uniref:DUF411 domain-containing protein n=1 Tax=Mariprofundus erugo TaxID=2528639 RepID=A0A5R9GRH5_9PROT|nr:DUF411 domain-containing protein [Mariprofundus erugo]TLS67023.1 DUF411 domain-containing protein [Mariprofundus erugo]
MQRTNSKLITVMAGVLISAAAMLSPLQAMATEVVMYKSPNCGCCTDWADSLRKEGFTVVENQREDMDRIKASYGVPEKLSSCHTATVNGYVIEGHVPAADVKRLLDEKPAIVGLTAPGMPMKSPGMQPAGLPPKNYDVLAFDKDGKAVVFSHY